MNDPTSVGRGKLEPSAPPVTVAPIDLTPPEHSDDLPAPPQPAPREDLRDKARRRIQAHGIKPGEEEKAPKSEMIARYEHNRIKLPAQQGWWPETLHWHGYRHMSFI